MNSENANAKAEDERMKLLNSEESSYNAPILISYIYKHLDEEQVATSGLTRVLNHTKTGEGCHLMYSQGAVECILKAVEMYRTNEVIMLLCCSILRQLLDCNYTRNFLIDNRVDVLRTSFNISHIYMKSKNHVVQAMNCLMQCARSEICRSDIFQLRLYSYLMIICKKFCSSAEILRPILKFFNWIATTDERMIQICKEKAVSCCLNCMKRHVTNPDVLAPGIVFLTRASSIYPPAIEKILTAHAVSTIIECLKVLFSNEVIQLECLKLIQALSKTTEGWKQISAVKGGWQIICQGTTLGNTLIHDLQGSFHNPGWCIGDTPNLPIQERIFKKAQDQVESNKVIMTSGWTSTRLQEFMGLAAKTAKRLAVNNEKQNGYFELVQTLDLLPLPGEEKEDWFKRITAYEKENEIKLDDMVATVIAMKARELEREKEEKLLEEQRKSGPETSKPLYVQGEKVTTQSLIEKDVAVDEQLEGIV